MHDINGKSLYVDSEIFSRNYGLMRIKDMKENHDLDKGGALIECVCAGYGSRNVTIRTHEHDVIKVRTWKELSNAALQVQDASNLSGVVYSFSEVIKEVRIRLESEGDTGINAVNNHPVCVLFSSKIASLTNSESVSNCAKSYTWALENK